MKTSRRWLEQYFDKPLPESEAIADALTFHVAEIEEVDGDLIDVNVLPDRAAYLLSHRGVALELASALGEPLRKDPLRDPVPTFPETDRVAVSIDAPGCARYLGALVTGVKVGPSPDWLREALESVGQRSINNIVDATNYVMLDLGQPLHAFDAGKLIGREGRYAVSVRGARPSEAFTSLSGDAYELPEGTLVIVDANDGGALLGVAGVKGGAKASVDEHTVDLIIEAANFDGTRVRKAAQSLKLFTDASSRFQNMPSAVLASYGMRDVLALIEKVAGGTLVGVVDVYPEPEEPRTVSLAPARATEILGTPVSVEDMREAFSRLGFSYTQAGDDLVVLVPFERRDLSIPEDLAEEVGRTLGYGRLTPLELPMSSGVPEQSRFRGIERIRDFLLELGYAEVSTPSFASEGEIALANPLQSDRPYLRASLIPNIKDALVRAAQYAPRVLGPDLFARVFEIGTVFTESGEHSVLSMGVVALEGKPARAIDALKQDVMLLEQDVLFAPAHVRYSPEGQVMELDIDAFNLEKLGEDYAPRSVRLGAFRPYSPYPVALRDVAVWTPEGTEMSEVQNVILSAAGDLLARIDLFDRFEKEGKVSYAFRLVFESMERTLTDQDLDPAMQSVAEALAAKEGWEVR